MAHFACIGPAYAGHLNPMAVVAQELRTRGHRATLVNIPDVASVATKNGLDFLPVGAKTYPVGWLEDAVRRAGRVQGLRRTSVLIRDLAEMTAMLCRELPDRLRAINVDMILCDQAEAAGGLVAYRLGLPFVSIAAGLPANWERGIPPAVFGWGYGSSRWHTWRNTAGESAVVYAMRPISAVIGQFAKQWGLRLVGSEVSDYMSGYAQISQLVPMIDMPRVALSGCFHYCGPLRRKSEISLKDRSANRTGRVFASLGSMQGHRSALFEEIASATAANGLHLTIAHGGLLDHAACQRLSKVAEVHDFVHQEEIMENVDLAVLHGGLNTVVDALAAGVPLVIAPLAFEQGAIAARVVRAGAAQACASSVFREQRLRTLVRQVHSTASYTVAAAKVQAEIRAAGGTRRATDIIEEVYKTGRPVLSAEGLKRSEQREGKLGISAKRGAA